MILWHRQGKVFKLIVSVRWREPGATCCFVSVASAGRLNSAHTYLSAVQGGKDRGGDNSPCMTQTRFQYAVLIENPPRDPCGKTGHPSVSLESSFLFFVVVTDRQMNL